MSNFIKTKGSKSIIIILIIILIIIGVFIIPGEKKDQRIKIGAADDSSGMLIDYIIRNKGLENINLEKNFEAYSVQDCCSSTAQWALSSQLIDVAIMCPTAAENLVKKDKRFDIIGPCILNSDIFVLKDNSTVKVIGVTQNRDHQDKMVKDKFGVSINISKTLTASLPYAYEKGIVDGILIDFVKAMMINGKKTSSLMDKDNVTYVLVVSKRFQKDKRYDNFMKLFKESVEELNKPEVLKEELYKFKNIKLSQEEMTLCNQLKVKFVFTTPQTN